jgi:hypothetical protein
MQAAKNVMLIILKTKMSLCAVRSHHKHFTSSSSGLHIWTAMTGGHTENSPLTVASKRQYSVQFWTYKTTCILNITVWSVESYRKIVWLLRFLQWVLFKQQSLGFNTECNYKLMLTFQMNIRSNLQSYKLSKLRRPPTTHILTGKWNTSQHVRQTQNLAYVVLTGKHSQP